MTLRKKRKRILLILLVLAAAGVGAWWTFGPGGEPVNSAPATARVVRRDLSSTVLATGAVQPQVGAEVKVGARISGRVEKLYVNVGDKVTKGQVLAELEKAELRAQVDLCQAGLAEGESRLSAIKRQRPEEIARARATLEEAKAAVRLAQVGWERTKELRTREVATAHELDTARTELDVASARDLLRRN